MKPCRLLILLLLATVLPGPASAADTPPQFAVGGAISVKKPVRLDKLAKAPERFEGKRVRLEGTVKAVCQGRGCWVEVEDARGASFIARSLDESVLLPKDCAGRRIVVQGVVKRLPQRVAEEPEAEGHACPRPVFVVATEGAELR